MASVNVSEFVVNPYTDEAFIDVCGFADAVTVGIQTLDKLIDENYMRHPLLEQQRMSHDYRNVGLGICGYATMLMKMGLRYGCRDALDLTDSIFSLMFRTAVFASNDLAKEHGSFPMYKECVWDSEIIRKHFTPNEIAYLKPHGLRNCSLLSIAPTGSIANLIHESGGCEPEFAIKYVRKTEGLNGGEDAYHDVYCRAAKEYMALHNTNTLPDYFVTSEEIPWLDRVKTQAVMQKHVDTAISSTINLPYSATKEDVAGIYLEAWKRGIKGITIFRNGCKRAPILSKEKSDENKSSDSDETIQFPDRGYILETSDNVVGKKRKLMTGCGSLHVTAFFDPVSGDLMETYLSKGSTGGCNNYMTGLSRTISLAARCGCSIDAIVDQLQSCGVCPSYAVRRATKHDTSPGSCCPMAVGNALMEMWEEMQNEIKIRDSHFDIIRNSPLTEITITQPCPECGHQLLHEGGCDICKNCGWSKCG